MRLSYDKYTKLPTELERSWYDPQDYKVILWTIYATASAGIYLPADIIMLIASMAISHARSPVGACSDGHIVYVADHNGIVEYKEGPKCVTRSLLVKTTERVKLIAAGKSHMVYYAGNTLYGIGNNERSQLGIGGMRHAALPRKIFRGKVLTVSCGEYHTAWLAKHEGENVIYTCGDNWCGQRGRICGGGLAAPTPIVTEAHVERLGRVYDVHCGRYCTIAITDFGAYYCGNLTRDVAEEPKWKPLSSEELLAATRYMDHIQIGPDLRRTDDFHEFAKQTNFDFSGLPGDVRVDAIWYSDKCWYATASSGIYVKLK